MWYIKDHLGNETGPFTFDELNSQLSQPALRENATLIKSGEQGAWKPALIALPDLFNDPLDDSVYPPADAIGAPNPYTLLPPEIGERYGTELQEATDFKTTTTLSLVAKDLNRMRTIMGIGIFYIAVLLYGLFSRASVQHLANDKPSSELGNSIIVCGIFLIFPLSVLLKLAKIKTEASIDSIQFTLKLHRKLWTSIFVASTVSIILMLLILLLS